MASAENTIPNDEIWYTSTNGNVVNPSSSSVFGATIQSNTYIDGKGVIKFNGPVKSIGKQAFNGCSGLKSVTIPNSVTSIGNYAFQDCRSLKRVDIPNNVKSIGSSAFADCFNLYYIYIPGPVSFIDADAFDECGIMVIYCKASSKPDEWNNDWNPDKRMVTWNSDFVVDGDFVFSDAGKTQLMGYNGEGGDVIIPDNVIRILENVFRGRTDLTSVTMPESFNSIKSNAFRGCSNLKTVNISSEIHYLGWGAFYGCSNMDSIFIFGEDNVIDPSVFIGCSKLTIYCSASSKPDKWDDNWNPSNRHVVWGCKTVSLSVNDNSFGTVSGGGWFALNSSITIKAAPAEHYQFARWSDGNTDNPRSINVTEDIALEAIFEKPNAISSNAVSAFTIYTHHNTIVVKNADADIYIYDAMGRLVARKDVARHVSIIMPQQGIYIVKVGAEAKKIMVW